MSNAIDFRPVILAGGSGTRFWPRSRRARAKQVLALDGERSMIQQTVERLKPLATLEKTWVITNEYLAHEIADQLPGLPCRADHAGAGGAQYRAGLRPRRLPDRARRIPMRCWASFPPTTSSRDEPRFLKALQKGIAVAAAGDNMVVLGIEPTRAETGYGYIETGDSDHGRRRAACAPLYRKAQSEPRRGVCGRGQLLLELRHVPVVGAHAGQCRPRAPAGDRSAAGSHRRRLRHPAVRRGFPRRYPKCENISVDYAVLEPRSAKGEHLSNLYCLPAEFSWNDLGSWASLYEYQLETRLRGDGEGNVAETGGHMAIEASDNYIYSPKKFVALVGVENLVIVDTEDALLIAHRDHSQDVGKIVKELGVTGHSDD